MPMRSISRAGLLVALLAAVGVARAGDTDWSVRVTPYDQVYPALEMSRPRAVQATNTSAQNTLGAGSGLVAINVRARHDGERVRVDIEAPGLQALLRSRRRWRAPAGTTSCARHCSGTRPR
jgi:hypothetical protein